MENEKIKSIQDLFVAILLSDSQIEKYSTNLKQITFTLEPHKQYILENYISRNHLENSIAIRQLNEKQFVIRNNILLERIVEDWTDGKQTVRYVNPQLLNTNVSILFICLFGVRGKKDVLIRTNMAREAQETLQYFLFELTGIHFIPTGKYFKIRLLNKLVAKSIIEGRPAYESMEMLSLLTEPEKRSFFNIQQKNEEEQVSYVFY